MRIGLGLPAQSIADVRSSAAAAVHYDFDSFSVYGDLGDLPPYAALHANADILRASTIRNIGPLGVPIALQHPEVTAMHAVALAEQLPGQTAVGVVRGAFLADIAARPATLTQTEHAVAYVQKRLQEYSETVPVYLGAFGPKMFALAGKLGVEGVKLGGSANPAMAELARIGIGTSATKIVLGAVSVIDTDRVAARARARHEVAKYLAVVGRLDLTLDGDQAASLAQFMDLYSRGDRNAPASISDALLNAFAVAGTPEDAIEVLQRMQPYVDRFEFGTPHGLADRASNIHKIGTTILQELETS